MPVVFPPHCGCGNQKHPPKLSKPVENQGFEVLTGKDDPGVRWGGERTLIFNSVMAQAQFWF